MKRAVSLFLTAVFVMCAFVGCRQQTEDFRAENEIFTYEKINKEKTQIVVSRTGNISIEKLCDEFENRNSDVQIIAVDITGGNADYSPLEDWMTQGCTPDVVMSASKFSGDNIASEYLCDLSADPIIQNYETEALARTAINGEIYWLPGPSDISAMMYNKTMFAQYGWEVPTTFDEFVTLCDRITKDTNGAVDPWNPNAKYSDELLVALEAFTYEELFGGAKNREWYNSLIKGEASFKGHMEPFMEVLKTLIDHNILREEHFTYSATARGKEFSEGKIAMLNMSIYDADNEEYDFGYMPFPTTKGTLGYLCGSYNCFVGLPKKEHTEKQADAIKRFIEFFSSQDGQRIYIDKSMKISNVKNTELSHDDDLTALHPTMEAGHIFSLINFSGKLGKGGFGLYQNAIDMTRGTMSGAECIAAADAASYSDSAVPAEKDEVIALVQKDMSILETSYYIADMYRAAADADIALIANNLPYRGNAMKFFKGDITEKMVTVFKPRSLANKSKLIKFSMSGQAVTDALNNPPGANGTADCIYAASGLICTVAPWGDGSKYLSVKLQNGEELQADKIYSVAAWAGTIDDKYQGEILNIYDDTWEELMMAKLRTDTTVTADIKDRIKLVWN